MGCFAMGWHSHDTWYGIGIEIDQWLAKGLKVVINGSRGYLNQAATVYPNLIPVLISAQTDRLRERLMARGRETGSEIEERLLLAQSLDKEIDHPKLVRINNDGELADAGNRLLALLLHRPPQPCT
jgi:ribose 1,5-bisphosphokinase